MIEGAGLGQQPLNSVFFFFQASCDRSACLKLADARHACKDIAHNRPDNYKAKRKKREDEKDRPNKPRHHWVRGNLPLLSDCAVCEEPCGEDPQGALRDAQCCWCHR